VATLVFEDFSVNRAWHVLAVLVVLVSCKVVSGHADAGPSDKTPAIKMSTAADGKQFFEVTGLSPTALTRLADAKLDQAQWSALFAVAVDMDPTEPGKARPAMLGSYEVDKMAVRFYPRFPLEPGVNYRAVFDPQRLPGRPIDKTEPLVARFELRVSSAATTVVEQIYPTAREVPENQFRFYVHFSAPMSRGNVYRHIHLLDAAGKVVAYPFLELDEELWDRDGKRFTLFFHPGRVKKGLKPREEMGPVLVEGKSYTLVIDQEWQDAQGHPLKEPFRKVFRAGPAQERALDPKDWKIQPPSPGTKDSVTVEFSKPLDRALLERLLWITDAQGQKLSGQVVISDEETRWHFKPADPWHLGSYQLVAETALEDSAGNSIARPFEVDVFRPVEQRLKAETIRLPFQVRSR
jgi:hypothetical protein